MLEEMDEGFGVGELIKESIKEERNKVHEFVTLGMVKAKWKERRKLIPLLRTLYTVAYVIIVFPPKVL